jgi:hypothetical protein
LHSIVLDRLLGLDAEKVREQTNLRYLRDARKRWSRYAAARPISPSSPNP